MTMTVTMIPFAGSNVDLIQGMAVGVLGDPPHVARPARADRPETATVVGVVTDDRKRGGPRSFDTNVSVCTTGTVYLESEQWARVAGGPLVPGEFYWLSDVADGHLSRQPGNFAVRVGVATSDRHLELGIEYPQLRLEGRIVESAWIRTDRRAFALVFADHEQQVWDVAGLVHSQIPVGMPSIHSVTRRIAAVGPHAVTDTLPKGSIRGAFQSLGPQRPWPVLAGGRGLDCHRLSVGGEDFVIALEGYPSTGYPSTGLSPRVPMLRAMRPDEIWNEV